MRRGRLVLLGALAVLALAASVQPASAATARLDRAPTLAAWRDSATDAFQPRRSLKLDRRPETTKFAARGSWWGGPVTTSTGEAVTVYVSDSFGQDENARLGWANFFAGLYHGSELALLRVFVATLSEVEQVCGAEAGGCYSPAGRALIFPGDLDPGIDADIAAHEYGHHVAANRNNDPWDALDWGPKRWATYVGVCQRTAAGTAFPGDEGAHYELNPGEGFAETFRVLNIQRGGTWANLPSIVDASLAPDTTSLAAALADVQQPWLTTTESAWDGRFGSAAPQVTKLTAAVGPGAKISLKTTAGAQVRTLHAGMYAITVHDASAKDNFHLSGGSNVSRRTSITGRGTVVWNLALDPGVYHFRSDAHVALGGSFSITAVSLMRAPGSVPLQAFPPQDRPIPTALDGVFQATVTGVPNATLELIDPATGQDLIPITPGAISYTICGQRNVLLRVASQQAGAFHVTVATP